MHKRVDNLVQFLAHYALYAVVPGLWFAYIGGVALWIGGAVGFGLALVAGLALTTRRKKKRGSAHSRVSVATTAATPAASPGALSRREITGSRG